jgi:hypothetical protein
MRKVFFILGMIVWLPSFIIGCCAFGRMIELTFFEEIVVSILFIGSLVLMKKNSTAWKNKD